MDASEDKVQESADVREDTLDLQDKVQPANVRDLEQLKQNMSTHPDLTPVAKQVRLLVTCLLDDARVRCPLTSECDLRCRSAAASALSRARHCGARAQTCARRRKPSRVRKG